MSCATLITYSAVCHLIVAIVMLIRVPHTGKKKGSGKNRLSFSLVVHACGNLLLPLPHPSMSLSPLHLAHPSFYLFVLYVFSNRCNNRLIWKTLNYRAASHPPTAHARTHAHTIKKKKKSYATKVLVKPESPSSFPPVVCLKKLVISLKRAPLCLEPKKRERTVFQWYLSECLKLFMHFNECADVMIGYRGRQMRGVTV